MERHKMRLLLSIAFMLAALVPLGIVSTVSYNYLEGTMNSSVTGFQACVKVRYGLFKYCEHLCNDTSDSGKNNCSTIEWDLMSDSSKTFGGNPELEMGFFFAFYGLGVLLCLAYFVPFCVRVKDSYFLNLGGVITACGILTIVFVCIFANSILDLWEKLAKDGRLEASLGRAYAFYIHIVFSSIMILSCLGSFWLLNGYADCQNTAAYPI